MTQIKNSNSSLSQNDFLPEPKKIVILNLIKNPCFSLDTERLSPRRCPVLGSKRLQTLMLAQQRRPSSLRKLKKTDTGNPQRCVWCYFQWIVTNLRAIPSYISFECFCVSSRVVLNDLVEQFSSFESMPGSTLETFCLIQLSFNIPLRVFQCLVSISSDNNICTIILHNKIFAERSFVLFFRVNQMK